MIEPVGTQPVWIHAGLPRVYHRALHTNQRYGSIITMCGKRGWLARTETEAYQAGLIEHRRWDALPMCARCQQSLDRRHAQLERLRKSRLAGKKSR